MLTNVVRGVRGLMRRRRRLVLTGRVTRGTRLGRSFLGGVDRRVHAPLGTVINFAGVLTNRSTSRVSQRRGRDVLRVVGLGGRLLLGLVGSVLRVSRLSSNGVSFRVGGCSVARVIGRVCGRRRPLVRPSLGFGLRLSGSLFLPTGVSHVHFARIVSGFLDGTGGFARGNSVALKYGVSVRRGTTYICMGSANEKVSRGRLVVVFSHFCGTSRFRRNDKLKLSVYGMVVRELSKHVRMRSRMNVNDYFSAVLPLTALSWGYACLRGLEVPQ